MASMEIFIFIIVILLAVFVGWYINKVNKGYEVAQKKSDDDPEPPGDSTAT